MSPDQITKDIARNINDFMNSDWLGNLAIAIVFIIITAFCARIAAMALRRILKSKHGPLPSATIFVNIMRVVVWGVGLCIVLSTCFDVNVQAVVTALGIGGIAISLGFQSTLTNLIGGVQIVLFGIVEPGDRIQAAGHEGVVRDITWGYTTIMTVRGETVLVPNSVISSDALVKLPPVTDFRLNIAIPEPVDGGGEALTTLVPKMQKAVDEAVESITALKEKTKISVNGRTERGYTALLTLVVVDGSQRGKVLDAIMKAISAATHSASASASAPTTAAATTSASAPTTAPAPTHSASTSTENK